MNPQKRQRRAMVRREVGPEEQPKQPTRRRRKGVAEKPAVEPQEPKQPRERLRRKTYRGKGPATPAWKAAGSPPRTEETDD